MLLDRGFFECRKFFSLRLVVVNKLLAGLDRCVNIVKRKVGEKGFLFFGLLGDPGDGLVAQAIREILTRFAIFQLGVFPGAVITTRWGTLVVPPDVYVETLVFGEEPCTPQVPLAGEEGRVTLRL